MKILCLMSVIYKSLTLPTRCPHCLPYKLTLCKKIFFSNFSFSSSPNSSFHLSKEWFLGEEKLVTLVHDTRLYFISWPLRRKEARRKWHHVYQDNSGWKLVYAQAHRTESYQRTWKLLTRVLRKLPAHSFCHKIQTILQIWRGGGVVGCPD